MKSEKVESEDSNSGETRHWVVCHDGALKEVKVEPTDWTPDTDISFKGQASRSRLVGMKHPQLYV